MSCVLRIFGANLNLDDLLKIDLEPLTTYEKDTPRVPSLPNGTKHLYSGAHYDVSFADFDEFENQKADAIEFLQKNQVHLEEMMKLPGVEGADLDFGICWRNEAVQCNNFPPKLCKLAGSLGLSLELSQYPPADDENE